MRLGIGDDCALLQVRPRGSDCGHDGFEHRGGGIFRLDWHEPEWIRHRTLARGLSDLAAMGARPVAAFLSAGTAPRADCGKGPAEASWMERFYDGFLALAGECKTPLAGGDLAQSPVAVADVVLAGAVPAAKALRRSGSAAGGQPLCHGNSGRGRGWFATAGCAGQKTGARRPVRISAGDGGSAEATSSSPAATGAGAFWLQTRGIASAAIDVSDGLSTDLMHICEESLGCARWWRARLCRLRGARRWSKVCMAEKTTSCCSRRGHDGSAAAGDSRRCGEPDWAHHADASAAVPRVLLRGRNASAFPQLRGWEHFFAEIVA